METLLKFKSGKKGGMVAFVKEVGEGEEKYLKPIYTREEAKIVICDKAFKAEKGKRYIAKVKPMLSRKGYIVTSLTPLSPTEVSFKETNLGGFKELIITVENNWEESSFVLERKPKGVQLPYDPKSILVQIKQRLTEEQKEEIKRRVERW